MKKRGSIKGLTPAPIIFGSYGTGGTNLIFVTKRGKRKPFKITDFEGTTTLTVKNGAQKVSDKSL